MTAELTRIGMGIEEIGRKASLESATARRYGELQGGNEDPTGELWMHLAHVADLVSQLAAWIIEEDEPSGDIVTAPMSPGSNPFGGLITTGPESTVTDSTE